MVIPKDIEYRYSQREYLRGSANVTGSRNPWRSVYSFSTEIHYRLELLGCRALMVVASRKKTKFNRFNLELLESRENLTLSIIVLSMILRKILFVTLFIYLS